MKHQNKMANGRTLRAALLLGSMFAAMPTGFAQEADTASNDSVGEIVVTATKRSENMQKVPIAISALGNQALEQKGITSVGQIGGYVPNIEIKNTVSFAGSSQILVATVRGIGQNDFAFNLEPGVGVYIDGVYYARSLGAVVDLLDLERIEVLKGPQGDLFGRNTIGGALNIVTRDPAKDFRYQLEGTTGSFSRTDVRGSIDIPLIDGMLLSQASFSYKHRDGYQKRIPFPGLPGTITDQGMFRKVGTPGGSDTQGGENAFNARFKLKWLASDKLDFLLSADYTRAQQEARPSTLLFAKAGANDGTVASAYNGCIFGQAPIAVCSARGVVGTSFYGVNVDADPNNDRLPISDAFVTGDIDKSYARGSNFDNLTSWGLSLTGNLEVADNASLKSITAYRSLKSRFGSEIAATPIILNDASFAMDQTQFSQELQLNHDNFDGRLKGTVGLYYFSETGSLLDTPVFAEGLIQIYGPNHFNNKAYATFMHEHFDVTDRFGLTFGVRYTKENKRFQGDQQDLNAFWARAGAGVDPNVVTSLPLPFLPDQNDLTRLYPFGMNKLSFSNVSFKAGAEYKFNRDVMFYYSFAQGFKSGGWTTRLLSPSTTTASDLTFRPERADTHEIGLKSTLLDGHLRLNMAAFTTAYKDIQVTEIIAISPVFKNAGEATIRGFEAEADARFGGFGLNAGLGYLDAHYSRMSPGATIPVTNNLVNAPEWSVTLGANYRYDLASGARITWNGDYNYKSNTSPDAENSPYLQSGNVGLLNSSIAFDDAGDRWGLTFGVKNITDKRFVVGGYDQSGPGAIGFVGVGYSPPRQWYLTLRVKS